MNGNGPTRVKGNRWKFSVWAPELHSMVLHIKTPSERLYDMKKDPRGFYSVECDDVDARTTYFYQPARDIDLPDPASAFQPLGVHGPSGVVDHHAFQWHDETWRGIPLNELVMYELHTGTFSEEGTFEGIIGHLDHLIGVGVNAIELMPVNQFPGERNWGYDGVLPYAVQNSYGGPDGLKRLVDACHNKGISVILDVVYNHFGPEGNYFNQFGPYFSKAHHVPWGDSINFDQKWADGVRDFFLNNITNWVENYHLDGLRLDAIHCIYDSTPAHILAVFNDHARLLSEKNGRPVYLIAESDLNDPAVVKDPSIGGYGFSAQWLDDFHHALYVLIGADGKQRYEDFNDIHYIAKSLSDGFVHTGEFVNFRKRNYGGFSGGINGDKFVVFIQNHDQVGNRVLGDRLSTTVNFQQQKLAAAAMILSPYIPMLFMGEEYAEEAPFQFFVSHTDPQLIAAVREGRKKEFADFAAGEFPDPEDEKTFTACKLRWGSVHIGHHAEMMDWYKTLIQLRKDHIIFSQADKRLLQVSVIGPKAIAMYRYTPDHRHYVYTFFNFSTRVVRYAIEGTNWSRTIGSVDNDIHQVTNDVTELMLPPESVFVYESVRE